VSLVAVASLGATYALPAGRDGAEAKRVLDAVAATRLEPSLAEALGARLPEDDESIWFVRRLDVHVTTQLDDLDEAAVANTWARATADALSRSLATESDNVVRFRNRAELLAQLVLDLADGRAANRWYFATSFYGTLVVQAAGIAIREALLSDIPSGLKALGNVYEARGLERVIGTLEESDATALLDAWTAETPPGEDALPLALAAARTVHPLLALEPAHRERDAVILVVAAVHSFTAAAPFPPVAGARGAIDLALQFRTRSGVEEAPATRLSTLAREDPTVAAEAALLFAPLEPVTTLLAVVSEPPSRAGAASRYAGGFLLLESLAELVLPDGRARALALARALAGEHAEAVLQDPLILFAAGCKGTTLEAGPEPPLESGLVERLVQIGRAKLRHVVAELIPGEPPLLVVRDAMRDAWLAIRPAEDDVSAQVAALMEELGSPEALLTRGIGTKLPIRAFREGDELPTSFDDWLRNARPAAGELEALGLGPDYATALVAHAVLRGFAGRLAGFGWSAAAYLRRTFLDGVGTVAAKDGGILVDLPASPLGIVLRMAGFDNRTVTVPWLDDPVFMRLPPP